MLAWSMIRVHANLQSSNANFLIRTILPYNRVMMLNVDKANVMPVTIVRTAASGFWFGSLSMPSGGSTG